MTSSLTGLAADPRPRIAREFKFAQGNSTGASNDRPVIFVANKTSDGSETVETLGAPIADEADCIARFGKRSEIHWMYRACTMVDRTASISAIAVAENGTATAATVVFTFTTTADDVSTIAIEWATERILVGVSSGDTAIAQAAAVAAAINAQPYLPFTAAQGNAPNDHKVTVTMSQLGPRGDFVLNALRVRYLKTIATTVAKAAITSGTGADDVANAIDALSAEFYYHVPSCTANTTVTTSDGGVGEYIQAIRDRALPTVGYDEQAVFGLDCTQAQATSVAISSAANSVYASFFRVESNDWPPWMVAAHCAAVKRSQEVVYPAANLAGYTQTDSTTFAIPDPYDKTDRPTVAEIKADLNNGITPIAFTSNGQSYIVRQITSYNVLSSGLKDYRAREGHIPSVVHFFWEELLRRYAAQRQPNIAADPPKGVKPIPGYDYPRSVKALIYRTIDDLAGEFSNQKALLDSSPDAIQRMKDSTTVTLQNGGFFVNVLVEPVVHNLFDDFLISQGGNAY